METGNPIRKCARQDCVIEFSPEKSKQVYCSPKCKKYVWWKEKGRKNVGRKAKHRCPECGTVDVLEFDPLRTKFAWYRYRCSGCGFGPAAGN